MTRLALHLLDSTAFAALLLMLLRLLARAPAAARHTLLLAAALKFALPLSAFFALGEFLRSLLPIRAVTASPGVLLYTLQVTAAPKPSAQSFWATGLFAAWLAGMAILLARWLRSARHPFRSKHRRTSPVAPNALEALERAQQRLNLRRSVALHLDPVAPEPYLTGILRPTIVLPESLPGRLTSPALEAVLLHELAHAARRDNLALAAVHLTRCVFWFHPLLPWLERRIRAEAELACDDLVLTAGIPPDTYVEGICQTCRLALVRPVGGRSYFANSALKPRLERIMSTRPQTAPALRLAAFIVLPALLTSTLAAGALTDASPGAESGTAGAPIAAATCAVAGVHLPPGTVTRQADHLLVCTAEEGKVRWVPMSEAARDRSKAVVDVDNPPPISCAPTAPVGNLCTCSKVQFSPGSVVDSPNGALVCPKAGGLWQPTTAKGIALPSGVTHPAQPQSLTLTSQNAEPAPHSAANPAPYHVGAGVTAPVLTYSVEPEYTEAARKHKIGATPLVALVVGIDGVPRDVHILRSASEGKPPKQRDAAATLDAAALQTVRQYRFKPGLLNGSPVPVELKVEVNFQIF